MIQRGQLIDWQRFPYELRRITDKFPEFEDVNNGSWLEYQWVNDGNAHDRWRIQNYMIDVMGIEVEKILHGEEKLLIWLNW